MKQFLIIFALLLPMGLMAQKIDVRAGYQAGITKNNGERVGQPLDAFYLGLGVSELMKSKIFEGYSGLEYMQVGWNVSDDTFRKIHYLGWISSLKANVGRFYGLAGLNLNIRLSEKYLEAGNNPTGEFNSSPSFFVPWHFGAGVRLGPVNIEARYHMEFINPDDYDYYQYFQVGVAVPIHDLGK